jgi:Trypsin-co-occurring domain 1
MAKKLINLKFKDGETIQAMVAAPPPAVKSLRNKKAVAPPDIDFELVAEKAKMIAEGIAGQFAAISPMPSSYSVAFGVTLTAGAGVVFATVGAEASLTVTLAWEKK